MWPTAAVCRALFLAGLVVAASGGCDDVTRPPNAPLPPDVPLPPEQLTGRIAFVSDRDGTSQIYVMNPDGSGLMQLTSDAASSVSPTWSPDGSKIAFQRGGRSYFGGGGIYVMQADGSGVTKLIAPGYRWSLSDTLGLEEPDWSPDGTRIAFVANSWEIWVINTDGSGLTRLSDGRSDEHYDRRPAWSPDGSKIAFEYTTADDNDPWHVYVMNADGSGRHELSAGGGPAWSPNGGSIAFWGFNLGVATMNGDGSGSRTLYVNFPAVNFFTYPDWSPDGGTLVFTYGALSSAPQLWMVRTDGSGLRALPQTGWSATWSHVSR